MIVCAAGCTTRSHLADCPDAGDNGDGRCLGCTPQLAAEGLAVCERCAARIRHALAASPGIVGHLRDHLEPTTRLPDDMPHAKGKKAPPAPLNINAKSDADDLHADLASWALLVMEERHVTGPDWAGSDIRPASKRATPDGLVYEDARVVGVDDWQATVRVVRFLFTHLDWILTQEWAGAFCPEITDKVRTLRFRYPTEQRPVYIPYPCPGCGCRTLRRYPPEWAGAPVTIKCDMVNCEHVIAEDGFSWLAHVVEKEKARQSETEDVA